MNLFATARLELHRGKPVAVVILGFSFTVAKLSFTVANSFAVVNTILRCVEQIAVDQQITPKLVSSITLLDFPSNFEKHKKMGDQSFPKR